MIIVWIDIEGDIVWTENRKPMSNVDWDDFLSDRARSNPSRTNHGIPNPRWGDWMILE